MTLRMADSTTVALLPATFDAYAGYVDGAWATFPMLQQRFGGTAGKWLLSISVTGKPAMCADVESGAMSSWRGYPVGYCSVSRAAALVASTGRPLKLWTAHYTGSPHICGPASCGDLPFPADGTQWTDTLYGRKVDQSLLATDFFSFLDPILPDLKGARIMGVCVAPTGAVLVTGVTNDGHKHLFKGPAPVPGAGGPQVVTQGRWTDLDLTDQIASEEGHQPIFIA